MSQEKNLKSQGEEEMRAVEDFVSRASSEKVFKQHGGCTVCSYCEVAAFEC